MVELDACESDEDEDAGEDDKGELGFGPSKRQVEGPEKQRGDVGSVGYEICESDNNTQATAEEEALR